MMTIEVIDSRATTMMAHPPSARLRPAAWRYTTYERVGEEAIRVVKKDGRIQSFDRRKILSGMLTACEKRPVTTEDLEAAANRVHHQVLSRGEQEIPSNEIGQLVMSELHKLDQVAYVRFASVYRQFKDLDEFMGELRRVIGGGGPGDGEKA